MISGSNGAFFFEVKGLGGRECGSRNGAIAVLRKSSGLTVVLRDNSVKIFGVFFFTNKRTQCNFN